MSLKIRLARGGTKKRPFYSIVVADSRSPRDGRFIEKLGTYNPMLDRPHADRVMLKAERIQHWIKVGALPTERVARFLDDAGLAKPEIRETRRNPRRRREAQERAKAAAAAAGAAAGAELAALMRAKPMAAATQRVCLGVITGAHGVKGEVRVKSFTAAPDAIAGYGPLEDEPGPPLRARRSAPRAAVIARVDGVLDRNPAERRKGCGSICRARRCRAPTPTSTTTPISSALPWCWATEPGRPRARRPRFRRRRHPRGRERRAAP